eukprot:TRINITY_DN17203_c2_g1_i3.p2 TRINITY_DN17203_c2_g1~~TRINITY_DN17203_c2_g1_i3.p2  ORF type:complete len:142 (+),score=20.31 TRINITY_DN17203_c2_g1_i3:53-427(+)
MADQWSKEVYLSRMRTAKRIQYRNFRLKSRGREIPEGNSGFLPMVVVFGSVFGYYWWKMQEHKASGRAWKSLPIISQFTRSKRSKKQQQAQRYENMQRSMQQQSSSTSSSTKKKGKKKKGQKRR